jgi:putative intracellular protease/amidase
MMRTLSCSILLSLALLATAAPASTPASAAGHWVCPPCGTPCDTLVFGAPGTCPTCGMALVDQATATASAAVAAADQRKVAILIFNAVEIIDSMGPYEVFGAAGCDVYTVAATKDPVTTAMGAKLIPRYSFSDAPQPDVLVVPGGGVKAASQDPATLHWVAQVTARDRHTMSVCNGAFILAQAGLLDGLTATTTSGNIDRLRAAFPKIKVVEDQRYVDNGKIITTAGLSAGIDGALHVVERLMGKGAAQQVALSEEYDWVGRSNYARAALADRNAPTFDLDSLGKWETLKTEGDTRHWEYVSRCTSPKTAGELLEHIDETLAHAKWSRSSTAPSRRGAARTSDWTFTGRDGMRWTASASVEPIAGTPDQYTARLTMARQQGTSAAR